MIKFKIKDIVHGLSEERCAMGLVTVLCRWEMLLFHPILWESHYNKLSALSNLCFYVSTKKWFKEISKTCDKRLLKKGNLSSSNLYFLQENGKGNELLCAVYLILFWTALLFSCGSMKDRHVLKDQSSIYIIGVCKLNLNGTTWE